MPEHPLHVVVFVVQLLMSIAFGVLVFVLVRGIARRSAVLGFVVAMGLLGRAVAAVALFTISYAQLPLLESLHTGDGFWELAPDARSYYQAAVDAVDNGLGRIASSSASPAFVRAVALWMTVVGVSPASPAFFNLVLYVATCWILVRLSTGGFGSRNHLLSPVAPVVLALTFSPALVLCDTQMLKDGLFLYTEIVAILAAAVFLAAGGTDASVRWSHRLLSAAVILAALYVLAGIRAYFVFLYWAALALAALAVVLLWRQQYGMRRAVECCGLLAAAWMTSAAGAGPYFDHYEAMARTLVSPVVELLPDDWGLHESRSQSPVTSVQMARQGFAASGGATNLASVSGDGGGIGASQQQRESQATNLASVSEESGSQPLGGWRRGESLARTAVAVGTGLAAIFVPMHLLDAVGIVEMQGGRGFLWLMDLDTLVLDAMVLFGIGLALRHRSLLWRSPVVTLFVLVLALVLLGLLAYVVTNFGTLFRLRLMGLVLLLLLPLGGLARAARTSAYARSLSQCVDRVPQH